MYQVIPPELIASGVEALNDFWGHWEDESDPLRESSTSETWPAQEVVTREIVRRLLDENLIQVVDVEPEVVHTSHMTTTMTAINLTYVVMVRNLEGSYDQPLAVRTGKQDAIDIALVYNADRFDRQAEVIEYDTNSVTTGRTVELPVR